MQAGVTTASVIIPAQNRADILPETLRCLSRQSVPPEVFEVVVVDDGSTDATRALLREAKTPFRLVCDRLEPRKGFCPARPRNRGLRLATGAIAIFMDADLLAGPSFIAGHLAAHAGLPAAQGVIGYTYGYPLDSSQRRPEALKPPPPANMLDELPRRVAADGEAWCDGREAIYAATRELADHPAPWLMFWTSNVSAPRGLALDIGGFDESFVGWGAEDLEFAYRLSRHGVVFSVAREAWGVHYPHPVPDPGPRAEQLRRNRHRILAKHPSLQLELQLRFPQLFREVWASVAALRGHSALELDVEPAAVSFLERLRADLFPPGRLLLCGRASAELGAHLGVTAQCQPFAPARATAQQSGPKAQHSPDAVLPLLGVFTPWEDGVFSGAIVAEYWRGLPPTVRWWLITELARVAGRVVLLCADPLRTDDAFEGLATLDDCARTLDELAPDLRWELIHGDGIQAFLVSTPETPGREDA